MERAIKHREVERKRTIAELWRNIEKLSQHARSQIEYDVDNYSEMMSQIKAIRVYLKKIERIAD